MSYIYYNIFVHFRMRYFPRNFREEEIFQYYFKSNRINAIRSEKVADPVEL